MTKLVNRAKMTTATTGTGTITLGTAESGYQSFADAGVVDGDVVRYVIEDGDAWEIGLGTYTASGTTLTRTVSESSNADAALNLTGDAVVFVSAAADDIVQPGDNISDLTNDAGFTTNTGTVTSVAASGGTGISVSGSPITTSGTLTITNTAPHQATNLSVTGGTTAGPVINSSTGTGTTLPTASATASGVVTTGSQTFAGAKTFNSTITGSVSGNAGTATALQNARTINGTSFNGSANITTANWGTARTLSFTGDVTGSASVNGSANVATSMTLANTGVSAGTYTSATVTVDAKGRVTSISSGGGGGSGGLGVDQTWQTFFRAFDTTYQNTTGKPILVCVVAISEGFPGKTDIDSVRLVVGSVAVDEASGGVAYTSSFDMQVVDSAYLSVSGVVPDGSTYSVTRVTGSPNLGGWRELR
jgi:hypothetical protein